MRRLVSIPLVLSLAVASVLLAPLWVPAAALVDALGPGTRGAALRGGAMLTAYLHLEAVGLAASFVLWLAGPRRDAAARERSLRRHTGLQRWWATSLLAAARGIYALRLEVEGAEAAARGPLLLFSRHASLVDALLPTVLVGAPYGIRLRHVLKRELLWDPCLDVVGNRLPNAFVRRGSPDSGREIEAVRELGRGLGPDEGVLLYPEGTRASPEKRARALARLRAGPDPERATRAARLRHLLPPRHGGPLALLDSAPDADVVFCAHTGLEGAGSLGELARGGLAGATVRVRFWRVPRAEVPAGHSARIAWLEAEWQRLDGWVDAARAAAAA